MQLLHLLVDFGEGLASGLAFTLLLDQTLRCFNGVELCFSNKVFFKFDLFSFGSDMLSFLRVVIKLILDFESFQFEGAGIVVFLVKTRIVSLEVLHFGLLNLVVLVVLLGVAERLVSLKLLRHHPLDDSVVREFALQFEQLLSFLPLVVRLCQFLQVRLIELCLGLFSVNSFLALPLFLLFCLTLIVNVLLDHTEGIHTVDFVSGDVVNQIYHSVPVRDLYYVESEGLLPLRL